MKLSPHYLKRYKDVGLLLLRYSQTGVNPRFSAVHPQVPGNGNSGMQAEQLPRDLERLGPTFVKLGQLLSSRSDLLPDHYLKSLARLQDKVKPFPYQDVEFTIETELGTRINKAFSHFDPTPLAAASLGQVHRAALHDGRPVVVKVQRPDITRQIEQDFAALEQIASFLNRHTRFGRHYQVDKILTEFETTIAHELDYCREAANMNTLRGNLTEFPRIEIPKPVEGYTTRKILTMNFIEGIKITELSPLTRLDLAGDDLAEQLFRAYLKQILLDGIFHADPHPGNVLLTLDHRVALLDLGMVGYTTPSMQEQLLKLLVAVSQGQSDEAAD
ncbi:MAG TPA: AarF/ABC1/UbiB kinase family protein, partial [Clostridia bacterium]|nr:AarF/ABC1/UbiB kinase family protein [Clostridia bacterium]